MKFFALVYALLFSLSSWADACDQAGTLNLAGAVDIIAVQNGSPQLISTVDFTPDTPPYENSDVQLTIDGDGIEPLSVHAGADGTALLIGRGKERLCFLIYMEKPGRGVFPFFAIVSELTANSVKADLNPSESLLFKKR